MKKSISIFLIFLISTVAFAQKTISGTVKNTEGDLVPSASVTVEEPGSDAIIAYGISNSKGEYKVTFTTTVDNVDVKVKAFNHRPLTRQVKNESQNLVFTLEPEATEIKEVQLKTKLITKKGDTITYDLKSFETKNDRVLADVLKKMPGMEVNKDGSILYQGQPLAKFYVNGKDLMEGGYGVINNSLPKDAVQKVEVMENHQPIKILQDKVPSDQAAINIKLKRKVTMTGRGEIGTGIADPALWNIKLTPMFFGQKNQWVVNYKTNNVGETVENEGNMFAMGNRWEGMRRNTSQNDWLNVENASIPSVPEKRYLLNNVHYVSANLLTNPFKNKEWELKGNASYTNNAVERESYHETNFLDTGAYTKTNVFNRFYTDKAKGELIFSKNAKKGFFKNTTTFTQFWNADRANGLLTSLVGGNLTAMKSAQALESPTSSFQNSLSTIIPWKERMVNLMSFVSYQNDRQNLEVNYLDANIPGAANDNFLANNWLHQDFRIKTFEANHSANLSFGKKSWTFTPEVGFNFNRNHMTSTLYGDTTSFGSDFMNDITYTTAVPFAGLRLNYKNEAWQLFANIPVNFNSIKAEDEARGVSKSVNKITFEPGFYAQYSFASFWKANVSGGLNYNFGEIATAYAGKMMKSPNSVGAMDSQNPIPENVTKSLGTRIEYRNPLNNLFFNVFYRINNTSRNLLASPVVNPLYSITRYIEKDNSTSNNSFGGEIGKYFPKFKTNAAINYTNSVSKYEVSQNDIFLTNKTNSQSVGFKFNNAHFSWLSTDYNFTYSWNNQNTFGNSNVNYSGYNHNLSVFLYPLENHIIGFYWDQINSNRGDTKYRNAFYDLSYQYAWTKKKIDFEVKLMNIANRKVFENYNISAFMETYSRMQLRPRQLMFTAKFNFK